MITPPRRNNFMINLTKKEKGFTLIELMIVVAIIGILAAIAIPQFSNYRTKAFNAAAVSDLHTARLAQEAVFADYQKYGVSALTGATTAAVVNSSQVSPVITTGTANEEAPITLSKNVSLAAGVNTGNSVAATITQHAQGDKEYFVQTDLSGSFQKNSTTLFTAVPSTVADAAAAVTAGYAAM